MQFLTNEQSKGIFWKRCGSFCAGLLMLIVSAGILHAQDFDHYQLQQSQGEIPEDLRLSSSQKYARDAAKIEARGKAAKKQGTFLLQSNFLLDELLLSGRVLFNDPVSQFVTQVKDNLLKNEPELQKSVKVYVVKSPIANAFATNGGTLLVNMGLIARLHSEAELAFVLAHEIQHYLKKHPMSVYVKSEELKRDQKMLGLHTQEDYLMAKNKYSRDIEQEADLLGFELYKQSGYSMNAVSTVFDVLGMASHPFDQRPWESSLLESDYFLFPASYSKWPLDSLRSEEDDADTLSTHPNTAKRRAAIQEKVAQLAGVDGDEFLVGPMEFLNVRKICRFEMCDMYLQQHAFEAAYYNAYLMQQEEPESFFLMKTMAKAVYGMASYRNHDKFLEYHLAPKDCEGERQQVQHFWDKLSTAELSLVAIRYCWQAHKIAPSDTMLLAMSGDLVRLFFEEHRSLADSMIMKQPATLPHTFVETKRKYDAQRAEARQSFGMHGIDDRLLMGLRSKIADPDAEPEKTEERKEEEEVDDEEGIPFRPWALVDLFQDPEFKAVWIRETKPMGSPRDGFLLKTKSMRQKPWYGLPRGKENVVFVQPVYKQLDLRKEVSMKYLESEQSLLEHKEMISKIAENCGLDFTFLETSNLQAGEADKFNDAAAAAECFHEIVENKEQGVDMLSLRSDDGRRLAEKYGTPYFVWTGVVTAIVPKPVFMKRFMIALCFVNPIFVPIMVYLLIKPLSRTYLITYLIDIEQGKILRESAREFRYKDRHNIIGSNLYEVIHSFKTKQ